MTRRSNPSEFKPPVPAGELPPFTPVPRERNRSDGWTPDRQRRFIEALADTGSVQSASKAVNMSRRGAYHLRRQSGADSFREAWDAAQSLGMQQVEDVAMDRALNGVEVPVYSYGKLVGTRIVYNDRLLMFMLRNRAPERFAEGKAKAMNALDDQMLARLKKQWRKEWEREQGALQLQREVETMASINAKIDAMRRKEDAAKALTEARRNNREPTPQQLDGAAEAARICAQMEKDAQAEREAQARRDVEPRVRTLKDEDWG